MKRQTVMYCHDCAAPFEVIFDIDAVMEHVLPEYQISCCPVCDGTLIDYVGHVDLNT